MEKHNAKNCPCLKEEQAPKMFKAKTILMKLIDFFSFRCALQSHSQNANKRKSVGKSPRHFANCKTQTRQNFLK